MVIRICHGLPCSILSISIYYRPQSNIPIKIYGLLNLLGEFIFNFKHLDTLWASIRHLSKKLWLFKFVRGSLFNIEHLNILWTSIKHPNKKLWLFEFARGFHVQFWGSRYTMGLNRTSKLKVMTVWIVSGCLF